MAVLLLYPVIFEPVIVPHPCPFKGAMCGTMKIVETRRKKAHKGSRSLIPWRRWAMRLYKGKSALVVVYR